MAEIIRMPRMSDTMEEGVIVEWHKNVGDSVEPGDVLAEVETDKATMELESYHEGVLLHIGIAKGPVPVNGVLAVIGEKGEDFKSLLDQAKEEALIAEVPAEKSTPAQTSKPAESNISEGNIPATKKVVVPHSASGGDGRLKASPLAKSMAADAGVDLARLSGTGENGRIVKRDVEAFISTGPKISAAPAQTNDGAFKTMAFTETGMALADEVIPVTQMRKTIARRLGESKFGAPHFYLTMEVDMEKTIAARKDMNAVSPVKISFNDIILKACAFALKQHPAVNASWEDTQITRHGNVHIGVAVAVDDGLLVPVVKHTDRKSLSQITTDVRSLAAKAREKKLSLEEMQGNTFTVSNLGMFGIEEFTAIINSPDACILAVGGIKDIPVVKDGQIVPGKRMKITLSCDHRVVDGATGAKFLQTVKSLLENPVQLLV